MSLLESYSAENGRLRITLSRNHIGRFDLRFTTDGQDRGRSEGIRSIDDARRYLEQALRDASTVFGLDYRKDA